jgi:glutamyl-tRNA synthetase
MTGVQAKFDLQKLRWMNGEYIAKKNIEEFVPIVKSVMTAAGKALPNDELLTKVAGLYKMRVKTLSEFVPMTDYFFQDEYSVEEKGVEKYLKPAEGKNIIREFASRLEGMSSFSHTAIEEACRKMAEEKGMKAGQLIHPTRVAISGKTTGAGLFEMMEVLGKDKVLERMRKASG